MIILTTFLAGCAYEYLGSSWAAYVAHGRPVRAALAAAGCALVTVYGLSHAMAGVSLALALAAGYGVGTWLAVKSSANPRKH